MVFVYIASFSTQYLIRPHPCGVDKPRDTPCSLHSDSNHQIDNTSHTQPLTSSMFTHDNPLHQHVLMRFRHSLRPCASSTIQHYRCIIIHFQGRFLHLRCMLSSIFRTAHSWNNLTFSHFRWQHLTLTGSF